MDFNYFFTSKDLDNFNQLMTKPIFYMITLKIIIKSKKNYLTISPDKNNNKAKGKLATGF